MDVARRTFALERQSHQLNPTSMTIAPPTSGSENSEMGSSVHLIMIR